MESACAVQREANGGLVKVCALYLICVLRAKYGVCALRSMAAAKEDYMLLEKAVRV